MMVKEALNIDTYKGIVKLVKAVLLMTLCFEAGGAVLSFLVFSRDYDTLQYHRNQHFPFHCGL